jgi:DNA-binding transcriptional ArsR family regulator
MRNDDLIFKVIAHPARREILALLAASDRSVKELTAEFDMSQPAISQHLKELKEAELVSSRKLGLEQRYHLTAEPIRHVLEWASQYRRFMDPSGHSWAFVADRSRAKPKLKKVN